MTEAEWLTCTDPRPMLEFLQHRVSTRKMQLFAMGCCLRSKLRWNQAEEKFQFAAEQWADGQADLAELERILLATNVDLISTAILKWADDTPTSLIQLAEVDWTAAAWNANMTPEVRRLRELGACVLPNFDIPPCREAVQAERMAQLASLRDLCGNPFRVVSITPSWITSTAEAIAQGIYEDRAFDRLPILADALEDAGCDNADILAHRRGSGPHVRGCWVIDLLLGKE